MQLLQHFNQLSLHPKNAKELKGLILQLAVQGKLTAQWRKDHPDVEPASILLEKIEKEKIHLVKEKKIKKEKYSKVASNEVYFDIPKSWEWSRLGNIGFVFNGDSINKSIKEEKYCNVTKGYPYIATKDVGYIFDSITHDNGVRIPFEESKFKVVKNGTVLICSEGGSAGKKMGIVTEACCFGNKLYAIEQHGSIGSTYILALYGSKSFSEAFRENMTGIIGGISRNNFANLIIPLPPREEQKAIVEVVEQLFTEVEQLEQLTEKRIQLKEQFAASALRDLATNNTVKEWEVLKPHFHTFFNEAPNIKKLRECILQLAVQGKLTANWRSINTALPQADAFSPPGEMSEGQRGEGQRGEGQRGQGQRGEENYSAQALLEKIKTEKAALIKAGKIKKEKPLPPITESEIPNELPEGWVWCRLGEVILYSDAGKSPNCEKRPVQNTEWGVLTTTAIQVNRFVENANKLLPNNFEINPQQIVKSGDILITRAGPINRTGIACKVQHLKYNLILSDKTIRLNYLENYINPDFVSLTLNSSIIRELLVGMMIGMASSQVNISQANIKTTLFPFPPLQEQKAIVETVNRLMALCDKLEEELTQKKQQVEMWMQAAVREVLGG